MKNLKVLDIAFSPEAKFTQLGAHFFDGLTSLEALHIEGLPSGAGIARGAFHEVGHHKTLKCFGLLTSTIPCSCDRDDPGYWLHDWLHKHRHTWTAEGKTKVKYTDESTSDGSFFLCDVEVTCAMTIDEHNSKHPNAKNVRKMEIPFHHFNWGTRCHPSSTTTTTTDLVVTSKEPCQERARRSEKDAGIPCDLLEGGSEEAHQMSKDEPIAEASRSGATMPYTPSIISGFFALGLWMLLNRV